MRKDLKQFEQDKNVAKDRMKGRLAIFRPRLQIVIKIIALGETKINMDDD